MLALLFLGGCIPLESYHLKKVGTEKNHYVEPIKMTATDKNDQCVGKSAQLLKFVEYDDFGNVFSRAQLNEAILTARQFSEKDGIVIVYVHGWHHNAKPGDPDICAFVSAVESAKKIDNEKFGGHRQILGIYVGWRGESIDSRSMLGKPFSVLTFWDRKNTAQAVGNGAVYELFRRLADIREDNPGSNLIVVGHSFGGALTFSAISHAAIGQIMDDQKTDRALDGRSRTKTKRWDLVVLINPAFEAMQLRPLFEVAKSQNYKDDQLPHLIIISTSADWANGGLFPLGRAFSTIFKEYADNVSSEMNTTAVGHYIPYITHQLAVSTENCKVIEMSAKKEIRELKNIIKPKTYCFNDPRAISKDNIPFLLTRCDSEKDCSDVAPGHFIIRGSAAEGKIPLRIPIMNIRTTPQAMNGHNDIWSDNMRRFLIQLLLITIENPKALHEIG